MSIDEEKILIHILDAIDTYMKYGSNSSYENALKSAQIVKDLSTAYLNITQASEAKERNETDHM